jgi:hypothetical protein
MLGVVRSFAVDVYKQKSTQAWNLEQIYLGLTGFDSIGIPNCASTLRWKALYPLSHHKWQRKR